MSPATRILFQALLGVDPPAVITDATPAPRPSRFGVQSELGVIYYMVLATLLATEFVCGVKVAMMWLD